MGAISFNGGVGVSRPRLARTGFLLGTSLFVYAAAASPAYAQNECGFPPPAGGTVTCPAGEYPNGITYDPVVADLTVVLEPGVRARDDVRVRSSVPGVDLVVSGPTDTFVESSSLFYSGVYVESAFGTVGVAVDDVTTDAFSLPGITAEGFGSAEVSADTVVTSGDFSSGIVAIENTAYLGPAPVDPTGTSVTANSISTEGRNSFGIFAVSQHAGVTVESGTIVTAGDDSAGISAGALFGDIVIDSDSIATSGNGNSAGIRGLSENGDVTITSGSVTTEGGPGGMGSGRPIGIFARTVLGDIAITSGEVSTAGDRAPGISTENESGATAITSETVATEGDGSGGILAESESGAIVITSETVTTAGDTILGQPGITAAGAHGIEALSDGGSITIDSTTITTGGSEAIGILAESGSGAIDIASGTITTADGEGIDAESVGGDVSIESDAITTTGGLFSHGIIAETDTGDIAIDSGTVSVAHGVGLFAITQSGNITITSDEVSVTGSGAGINASGEYYTGGDISVTSGSVETTADFTTGIDADSRGAVSIVSTSITTTGERSIGIEAASFDGGITIESGTVDTAGNDSRGIKVNAYNAAEIDIVSGTVTTLGDNGDGIVSLGGQDTRITSTSISTEGHRSNGIYAYTFEDGDIVVTSGAITVAGDTEDVPYGGSHGIEVHANDGSITVASTTIGTEGAGSFGILATSNSGAINITSGTVTTLGDDAIGISATTGPGATTPELPPEEDARLVGEIVVAAAPVATPPDVSITSISVTTDGDNAPGLAIFTLDGDIYIESGSVDTSGVESIGILAESKYGSITVDSGTVATSGADSAGIDALVIGGGDIEVISTSVTTDGNYSSGIVAATEEGAITVDSGAIDVSGNDSRGISVIVASGLGAISITSDTMSVAGPDADGIYARGLGDIIVDSGDIDHAGAANAIDVLTASPGGDINITSGDIAKSGAQHAIIAHTTAGDVSITSDSIVSSFDSDESYGDGILAISQDGDVTVDSGTIVTPSGGGITALAFAGDISVTSGSVTSGRDLNPGIFADSDVGDVDIDSGAVVTTGDDSPGISATADSGSVTIDSGSVTTSGDQSSGIAASAPEGDVDISSTGTVQTSGDTSVGIVARALGVVTIASNVVVTTGDGSIGILAVEGDAPAPAAAARTAGGATVAALGPDGGVTVRSGSVTTSGDGSEAIAAVAFQGDVEVFSTGTVTTTGADSHGIFANSDNGFALVDAANVSVGGAGSDAIVITAATDIDVIIRGLVESTQGFAVQADGPPASVSTTPSGTIRGRVDLTDGADTLANAGTFDAIGTSAFGGGTDLFTNSGTTRSVNGAAVLGGLEQFNSSGLVTMADGAANDRLTVGDFVGLAGSRLIIDVDFTAGVADVLVTGAATGSTSLQIGASGSPLGFTQGILVVDGSAGTSPTAFTLAGGATIANGFVVSGLIFRPADFDFLLINTPNQPVFETSQVGEIVTNVWQQSADAVFAQIQSASDRPDAMARNGRGFSVWGQMWAGGEQREGSQAFTLGATTTVFDVGYRQDYEGVQGGIDHQSGNLLFGVTFGLGSSDAEFVATSLDIDIVNLGAYGGFRAGVFYVNALVKYDWLDVTTNPGPGLSAAFDASEWGAQVDAGARFEFGRLFAEPSVGVSWISADIDDFGGGGAVISFDEAESLRGYAGLRLGGVFDTGGAMFAPFVGGRIIEEFNGENENDFVLGSNIHFVDQAPGNHGELSAGLSVITDNIEVFVRGAMLVGGDDVDGEELRGGVRIRF